MGLELLRQFSAGIVILCEDFRYSHIIRELPGYIGTSGLEPVAPLDFSNPLCVPNAFLENSPSRPLAPHTLLRNAVSRPTFQV